MKMADKSSSKSKSKSKSKNKSKGKKSRKGDDINSEETATIRKPIWIDRLQTELLLVLKELEELENPRECELWEEDWMTDSTSTDNSDYGMFVYQSK